MIKIVCNKKQILRIPISKLIYGKRYGVTLKEAKRGFLSGMNKTFKKKTKIIFVRRVRKIKRKR